jgi:NADPH2:quinone reductase
MKAIVVNKFGGPESLEYMEVEDPVECPGFKVLQASAIGVNFADTHQTENTYFIKSSPPFIPGSELIGINNGKRYIGISGNAYAERVMVPEKLCFNIDDGITDSQALACAIQGVTALKLLEHVKPGSTVLVYGASSGVGIFAMQIAKLKGARVIAVTSELKIDLVSKFHPDSIIVGERPQCRADYILDMIGGSTFQYNLNILNDGGTLILYGMASRELTSPVDTQMLMTSNKTIKGFWLHPYFNDHTSYQNDLNCLYRLILDGKLSVIDTHSYPLKDASQAHRDVLGRKTAGKVHLIP